MNTKSGTVVGEAEGQKAALNSLKQWLSETGSPSSHIDKATFSDERALTGPSKFAQFDIKK